MRHWTCKQLLPPPSFLALMQVFELIEGFAKALDLDYDGPECAPSRNGQKPCLLLDLVSQSLEKGVREHRFEGGTNHQSELQPHSASLN